MRYTVETPRGTNPTGPRAQIGDATANASNGAIVCKLFALPRSEQMILVPETPVARGDEPPVVKALDRILTAARAMLAAGATPSQTHDQVCGELAPVLEQIGIKSLPRG